jgi:MoaA/NifB/PqqE/SkfB family radical SAM enzyme
VSEVRDEVISDTVDAGDRSVLGTSCLAATMHLYLAPDGDVRACCRNWEPLGNIATQRLGDIWAGAIRADLQRRLAVDDFSLGCQQCDAEVLLEGRQESYRANFDRFAPLAPDQPWPLRIEFNVSNACNLQCVQCNGFLSSSIRTHRDNLPPLPKVYGEEFFEDLRSFIPHLGEAQFAGGEPLLAPENFRIWDMIEELAPGLPCTVVTNATQWTPRIERLFNTHRMGFAFSIDGATKQTYESIRIGADFDEVMANMDRYTKHALRSGMTASINHCLMAQNFHEFHLMLRMAEERGLTVDVSVVRSPGHSCVAHLPREEIQQGLEVLRTFDAEMRELPLNAATWVREMTRLEHWATLTDVEREHVWWDDDRETLSPQSVTIQRRKATEDLRHKARILDFPCLGVGPTDDAAARAELSRQGRVLAVTVEGDDSRIIECDEALLELIGVGEGDVIGRESDDLMALLPRRFGALTSLEEVSRTEDRAELVANFEKAQAGCILVALRDSDGWAARARMLFTISER